ncbi:MAG: hypothetical protein JST62_11265 [Bacteroidetes bacterium]|nr:hypothetical protein [Bacteroidota bacterium]
MIIENITIDTTIVLESGKADKNAPIIVKSIRIEKVMNDFSFMALK